jgi:hypothetical protein
LYDIVLNDEFGWDLMGGALADRSASAVQVVRPKIDGTNIGSVPVDSPITMVITHQNTMGALGKIKVYLVNHP